MLSKSLHKLFQILLLFRENCLEILEVTSSVNLFTSNKVRDFVKNDIVDFFELFIIKDVDSATSALVCYTIFKVLIFEQNYEFVSDDSAFETLLEIPVSTSSIPLYVFRERKRALFFNIVHLYSTRTIQNLSPSTGKDSKSCGRRRKTLYLIDTSRFWAISLQIMKMRPERFWRRSYLKKL